jgi:hypothetical protein
VPAAGDAVRHDDREARAAARRDGDRAGGIGARGGST